MGYNRAKRKMKKFIGVSLITIFCFITSSEIYAQGFFETLIGVAAGYLEQKANTNNNFSDKDKENARYILNYISEETNANHTANRATQNAMTGNKNGAIIDATQVILNTAGNYTYDTYLNTARDVNDAKLQYNQDINNGVSNEEALKVRNEKIGYSIADAIIETEEKVAQKRAEHARQLHEERELKEQQEYYYIETNNLTTHEEFIVEGEKESLENLNNTEEVETSISDLMDEVYSYDVIRQIDINPDAEYYLKGVYSEDYYAYKNNEFYVTDKMTHSLDQLGKDLLKKSCYLVIVDHTTNLNTEYSSDENLGLEIAGDIKMYLILNADVPKDRILIVKDNVFYNE